MLSLVDPDIKPMHSITKEAGVDLWLFKRRVMFDFTYFVKNQNDQLGSIPLVQGTGFSSMTTNVGDVQSKGYEWGLTISSGKDTGLGMGSFRFIYTLQSTYYIQDCS